MKKAQDHTYKQSFCIKSRKTSCSKTVETQILIYIGTVHYNPQTIKLLIKNVALVVNIKNNKTMNAIIIDNTFLITDDLSSL